MDVEDRFEVLHHSPPPLPQDFVNLLEPVLANLKWDKPTQTWKVKDMGK